ncbi:receptor activity-modifying protein 3 isoform X1 [Ambystoma mexicanum]|uniref:receptor activity-modifying protein 3 isoform X1 n=1 Tax=Ambystoma mexicanum TaxID=8296 RepID=UPI0037E83E4A
MEKHAFALLQLLASMMCVSGLVTTGTPDSRLPGKLHCNESLMLERLPVCGKRFEDMMRTLGAQKWCNLTEFIVHYDTFSSCTEAEAKYTGCFWPNPHTECYITGIHKKFFSNCTSDNVVWEDPPDEILTTLILIPVVLTAAMISLVVWCSKRSDIFM